MLKKTNFRDLAFLLLASSSLFYGCGKKDGSSSLNAHNCPVAPHALSANKARFMDEPAISTQASSPQRPSKKLRGHVPQIVNASSDQGKLDDNEELSVTFALDFNNRDELITKLRDMYRPGSPSYHKFLKPEEFRAKYAPAKEQVAKVQQFIKDQGLEMVSSDGGGSLIKAKGPSRALNKAFHTEIHRYTDPKGKSFHAPAFELQIPDHLTSVQGVHGLQNFTKLSNHLRVAAQNPHEEAHNFGGNVPSGLNPADIRFAYNVPKSLDGSGQTLALFELDGYNSFDIIAYEKAFNLPSTPLENILVGGVGGAVGNGAAEVTLDIELMIALAPKAKKILIYEAPNTEQGVLDAYSRIANDNLAQSISTSWGASEDSQTTAFLQTENNIFLQMAMQGQTIYAATGDSGAYDDGSTISVDDPGTQPYVVAVGGTTLYRKLDGTYDHESAWNSGSPLAGAGGGGISTVWTIPFWQQQNDIASKNQGSSTMRNVPDVSLNADPNTGYSIYFNGSWHQYGGTSCAAPLWAAFNALLNQQRAANGLPSIGYISPLLYQIGQSQQQYSANFFDIADNTTNLFYPAGTGYDNATGLGSFNGDNLLPSLADDPASTRFSNSSLVSRDSDCNP